MRKKLKKFILRLINLVEKIEFRNLNLDQNDPTKKIIAEYDLDVDVLSDTGFVKAYKYLETQPYDVWFLELENGDFLDCADIHIVYDQNLNETLVKDLQIGDLVMTSKGPSKVKYLENTGIPVSMVDLSIDHPNHRYYTNDILSHNSITSAIILVWYLLFNHDKNAMLLANVGSTAEELMDKIKAGDTVKYLGCTIEQVRWGSNDDPNGILIVGNKYYVEHVYVHSQHTKIELGGVKGKFNSVCFEKV
jgi:hypothetical protein